MHHQTIGRELAASMTADRIADAAAARTGSTAKVPRPHPAPAVALLRAARRLRGGTALPVSDAPAHATVRH